MRATKTAPWKRCRYGQVVNEQKYSQKVTLSVYEKHARSIIVYNPKIWVVIGGKLLKSGKNKFVVMICRLGKKVNK